MDLWRAQRRHWQEDLPVAPKRIRFRRARGWSPAWRLYGRHEVSWSRRSGGGWAECAADAASSLSSSVNTPRRSGEVAPGVAECGASVGHACESRGRTHALGSSRSGGGLSHLLLLLGVVVEEERGTPSPASKTRPPLPEDWERREEWGWKPHTPRGREEPSVGTGLMRRVLLDGPLVYGTYWKYVI